MTSFLNVLDAERSLYTTQDQLAQNDAALSADMVALFKGSAAAGRRARVRK